MSRTGTPQSQSGSFASSRRGTVADDSRFIYLQRAKGVSVQNIARQIGRSAFDVAKFLQPIQVDATPPPERWPFASCDPSIQPVVRLVCAQAGMTLKEVAADTTSHKVWRVRRAVYAAIRTHCPGVSYAEIGNIFSRSEKVILEGVTRHHAEMSRGAA